MCIKTINHRDVTEDNYFIQNSSDRDFKTKNQFYQIIEKKNH